jgi:prepilin-type N-terminal cleavage/methylation domain-containing protein/prepilin-type processing-associated H-X9-DG protein
MSRSHRRGGFNLIELLVVIAIIALLIAIILPVLEKVRHKSYISACAANLHSIGQAMFVYANDNHGELPRAIYDATRASSPCAANMGSQPDAFHGPAFVPNDVTCAIFLLMRSQRMPARVFICPYNDVLVYEPDPADPQTRANFTDCAKNLGYSLANPYPSAEAVAGGYKWTSTLPADFALAADRNNGSVRPEDDVTLPTPTSSSRDKQKANSRNHEKDGQNVLYGDGHVSWEDDIFCGAKGDNIYANKGNRVWDSPVDRSDSVLLP